MSLKIHRSITPEVSKSTVCLQIYNLFFVTYFNIDFLIQDTRYVPWITRFICVARAWGVGLPNDLGISQKVCIPFIEIFIFSMHSNNNLLYIAHIYYLQAKYTN